MLNRTPSSSNSTEAKQQDVPELELCVMEASDPWPVVEKPKMMQNVVMKFWNMWYQEGINANTFQRTGS